MFTAEIHGAVGAFSLKFALAIFGASFFVPVNELALLCGDVWSFMFCNIS
jgi:hypothetical protein